jgi:hypothetical protein
MHHRADVIFQAEEGSPSHCSFFCGLRPERPKRDRVFRCAEEANFVF